MGCGQIVPLGQERHQIELQATGVNVARLKDRNISILPVDGDHAFVRRPAVQALHFRLQKLGAQRHFHTKAFRKFDSGCDAESHVLNGARADGVYVTQHLLREVVLEVLVRQGHAAKRRRVIRQQGIVRISVLRHGFEEEKFVWSRKVFGAVELHCRINELLQHLAVLHGLGRGCDESVSRDASPVTGAKLRQRGTAAVKTEQLKISLPVTKKLI